MFVLDVAAMVAIVLWSIKMEKIAKPRNPDDGTV